MRKLLPPTPGPPVVPPASEGNFFQRNWRTIAKGGLVVGTIVAITACTAATAGVCAGAGGVVVTAMMSSGSSAAFTWLDDTEGTATWKDYGVSAVKGGATGGLGTGAARLFVVGNVSRYRTFSDALRLIERGTAPGGKRPPKPDVINHLGFGTRYAP